METLKRQKKESTQSQSLKPSIPLCPYARHGAHNVQFYETDEFLYHTISQYTLSALQNGEAIILVATRTHLDALETLVDLALLKDNNSIDNNNHKSHNKTKKQLQDYKDSGQCFTLDAEETLKRLFGSQLLPDRQTFFDLIGGLIHQCLKTYPFVRIYGEVVHLLWRAGNLEGTLALEQLWNEFPNQNTWDLLCGYDLRGFNENQHGKAFQDVCQKHPHVLPAESYSKLHPDAQMRFIAQLQQQSMALQTEISGHRATEIALRMSEEQLKRSNEELRRANEELLQANSRLLKANEEKELANRAKSTFLANISHELRTPLAGIVGFAELMLDPSLEVKERREATEIIIQNGRHLTSLLNDLLDLSKVESGCLEVEKTPFCLTSLMSDISAVLGILAQKKGLELTLGFSGNTPPSFDTIMSDPHRLRQILVNVIGNAIKFTESGRVEATFQMTPLPPASNESCNSLGSESPVELKIFIKDSGSGITPEQANRLFQPFSQGDSSISRRYGGTGLGLFLSRQMAHLLGGDLYLKESQHRKGSTFVLKIKVSGVNPSRSPAEVGAPLESASTAANEESKFKWPPTRGDDQFSSLLKAKEGLATKYPVSILLADDNDVNRLLLTRVLKRVGYTNIQTASDGLQAVNLASQTHFDLIFMDIQMPNMDGITASQTVRKLYQGQTRNNQPVIVALTAHTMQGDKEQCLSAGMDDFVSKPVNFGFLLEKLEYWVSRVSRFR